MSQVKFYELQQVYLLSTQKQNDCFGAVMIGDCEHRVIPIGRSDLEIDVCSTQTIRASRWFPSARIQRVDRTHYKKLP